MTHRRLVTHAAIADGRAPDPGQNVLARVAEGIAYRAVRNRGTIGGSLCHADPAADWVTVLTALGATALTSAAAAPSLSTTSSPAPSAPRCGRANCCTAVRVPRLRAGARWGYVKACRKPGEFAHAMAAVLIDDGGMRLRDRRHRRPPVLLHDEAGIGAPRLRGPRPRRRAHPGGHRPTRALAQARA